MSFSKTPCLYHALLRPRVYDDCVDLLSFSISVGYDAFLGSGREPQDQYIDFDTDENPDALALWRITQCRRACLAKPI
jgi:hypothetical protein